jgi:hypothetical protein
LANPFVFQFPCIWLVLKIHDVTWSLHEFHVAVRVEFDPPNVQEAEGGPLRLASGRALSHLLKNRYNTTKRTPAQAKLVGEPMTPVKFSSMSFASMKKGR